MLKLTRTGIGLLTRQYRSVLHKCFLINFGLFTLGAALVPLKAKAEVATLTSTLDTIRAESIAYLQGSHGQYSLSTDKGSNTNSIMIGGVKYYYKPGSSDTAIVNLANTGGAALIAGDSNNYVFKYDDGVNPAVYYTYDISAVEYLSGAHSNYELSTTQGDNTQSVVIGSDTYWYTPNESSADLDNKLVTASAGGAGLTTVGATEDNHVFKIDNGNSTYTYYTLTDKLAKSGIKITEGTADDYDVAQTQADGTTVKYYKITHETPTGYTAGMQNTNLTENVGNTSYTGQTSAADTTGGALTVASGNTVDYITGDFSGNSNTKTGSQKVGGALYDAGNIGSVTGDFYENTSGQRGGGINVSGTVDVITGDFYGNEALSGKANGGAINIVDTGYVDYISGNFINNRTIGDSSGNNVGQDGGAINVSGKAGLITGNFVNNSVVNRNGGAVSLLAWGNNQGIVDSIIGDFTNNSAKKGGAVRVSGQNDNGGGKISSLLKGNFVSNEASVEGGAYWNSGTVKKLEGTFVGNTAGNLGGAIYNSGTVGAQNVSGVTADFTNNSAKSGGAIYNTYYVYAIDGKFENNRATDGDGGAIYNEGEIRNLKDVTPTATNPNSPAIKANFTGNTATGKGGAIFNTGTTDNHGKIARIEGNFEQNSAANGGAVYNEGWRFLTDTKFGGAVSKFSNNTATTNGGAIYNANTGEVGNITGVLNETTQKTEAFVGNKAGTTDGTTYTAGSGGAVYNTGTMGTITGDITGNTAGTSGGAIYNIGTVDPDTGDIIKGKVGKITGDIKNNTATAGTGGAIYNNSGTFAGIIGDISGNTAAQSGGAIYNEDGTISGITGNVTGNRATSGLGGAIYNTGTVNIVTDANNDILFNDNKDSTGYNDIYSKGGTVNLSAAADRTITFNGTIDGKDSTGAIDGGYTLAVTGGNYVFNNMVNAKTINLTNVDSVKLGKVTQADNTTQTTGKLATSITDLTIGYNSVKIGDNRYYYVPTADDNQIVDIIAGGATLETGTANNYVFTDGNGHYWKLDSTSATSYTKKKHYTLSTEATSLDLLNESIDNIAVTNLTLSSPVAMAIETNLSGSTPVFDMITATNFDNTGEVSNKLIVDAINVIADRNVDSVEFDLDSRFYDVDLANLTITGTDNVFKQKTYDTSTGKLTLSVGSVGDLSKMIGDWDNGNYIVKYNEEQHAATSVGANLELLDTAIGKVTTDGHYIKAYNPIDTANTSVAANLQTLDQTIYDMDVNHDKKVYDQFKEQVPGVKAIKIDKAGIDSAAYLDDNAGKHYTLSTDPTAGLKSIKIAEKIGNTYYNNTYYYTPTDSDIAGLVDNGYATLKEVSADDANWVFTDGNGSYWKLDATSAAAYTVGKQYTLSTTGGSGKIAVVIGNQTYYFKPETSDTQIAGIISGGATFNSVSADNARWVFTNGSKYWTLDTTKHSGTKIVESNSNDYNYKEELSDGRTKYYKVVHVVPDGYELVSQTESDKSKYTNLKESIDEKAFHNLHRSAGGAALTIQTNSIVDHITADFKGNYVVGTQLGTAGAVSIQENATLNNLTGSFEANIGQYGGVVQNKGYVGHILGDFVNNEDTAGGAAIDTNGTIDTIVGDFLGNFDKTPATETEAGKIYNGGGAIRNTKRDSSSLAKIGRIEGEFINNYALGKFGGAINNQGTIDYIDAKFTGNNSAQSGGAIFNMAYKNGSTYQGDGLIGKISGDFLENIAGSQGILPPKSGLTYTYDGGAIYNNSNAVSNITSTIEEIDNATFTRNSALGSGGAIYSGQYGKIGEISADFIENFAKNGSGGAIAYIGNDKTGNDSNTMTKLSGDFLRNTTLGAGGALYLDKATINNIEAKSFTGNKAIGDGGAIMLDNTNSSATLANGSVIAKLSGDFIDNSADKGGAIYNKLGTIHELRSNFSNNASFNGGGAIYNEDGLVDILADEHNIAFYNNTSQDDDFNEVYNDIHNENGRVNLNAAEGRQISFGGSIIGNLDLDTQPNGLASGDIDREHNTIGINTEAGVTGGTYIFNNVIEKNNVEWHNSANIKFGSQVQEDGSTTYGYVDNVGMVEITQAPYLFRAYDEEGGYYNHWSFDTTDNQAAADYLKYYDKIDYVMTDITDMKGGISISSKDYKFKIHDGDDVITDLIANGGGSVHVDTSGKYIFTDGSSNWTLGSAANDANIEDYLGILTSNYELKTSSTGATGEKQVTIGGTKYYYTPDSSDTLASLIANGAIVREMTAAEIHDGTAKAVFHNADNSKVWTIDKVADYVSSLGNHHYDLTNVTAGETAIFKIDDTSFVYTPETDEQISSIASAATLTEVGEDEKWVFRYTDSNNNTKYWKLDDESAAQYTKNLRYTLSKDVIEGASSVVIGDTTYYYKPGDTAITALTGNTNTGYSFIQTAILDTVNNHLEDNVMQQLFLEGDVKLRVDVDLGNSYRYNPDGISLGNGSDTFKTQTRNNSFGPNNDSMMIIDSINLLGASRKDAVAVEITNKFNHHVAVSPNILENIGGADNLHGKVEYRDETGELVVHDRFAVISDLADALNTLVEGTVATYHGMYELDENGDYIYLKATDAEGEKYTTETARAQGFTVDQTTNEIIDPFGEKIKKFDPLVGTITYSSNDESVTEADDSTNGIFHIDTETGEYDNDYRFVKGRAVRLLDEKLVHKEGDETIKGIKTFESETVGSGAEAKKYTTALNGTTLTMSEVVGTETPTVTNTITLDGSDGSASFAGNVTVGGLTKLSGDTNDGLQFGDNGHNVKGITNSVIYTTGGDDPQPVDQSDLLVTAEAVKRAYTAGTGIAINNGVISNTQTSAEWGSITGNIADQADLQAEFAQYAKLNTNVNFSGVSTAVEGEDKYATMNTGGFAALDGTASNEMGAHSVFLKNTAAKTGVSMTSSDLFYVDNVEYYTAEDEAAAIEAGDDSIKAGGIKWAESGNFTKMDSKGFTAWKDDASADAGYSKTVKIDGTTGNITATGIADVARLKLGANSANEISQAISSSSTHDQLTTAKAVYDYVEANGGKIQKITVGGVEKEIVNKTVALGSAADADLIKLTPGDTYVNPAVGDDTVYTSAKTDALLTDKANVSLNNITSDGVTVIDNRVIAKAADGTYNPNSTTYADNSIGKAIQNNTAAIADRKVTLGTGASAGYANISDGTKNVNVVSAEKATAIYNRAETWLKGVTGLDTQYSADEALPNALNALATADGKPNNISATSFAGALHELDNEKFAKDDIVTTTNNLASLDTTIYSAAKTDSVVAGAISDRILLANPSDTQFLKTVRNNLGTYGEKAVSAGAMMQFAGEIGYNMKQDQLGWDINVDTSNADSFSEKLTSSLYDGLTKKTTARTVVGALNVAGDAIKDRKVTLGTGENLGTASITDGTNTTVVYTKDKTDTLLTGKANVSLNNITSDGVTVIDNRVIARAADGTYNPDSTTYADDSIGKAIQGNTAEIAKRTVTLNNVPGTTTPDGTATVSDGATDATFYTKDMVDAVFADKQDWANKEFGYDTDTTDAPTVLEAAGFVKEDGKLGFSQAIIQNKRAIEAGSKYFAANSTEAAASATGTDSVAIGPKTTAIAENAVALGGWSDAKGYNSIAIGANADVDNDYGIAIGGLAKAKAEGGIALGTSANVAENAANSMALGNSSKAEGATSVALGQAANAKGESSISMGTSSKAEAATSVALGHQADAIGESGIAIGTVSKAKTTAVALGHNANADGESALAMGTNTVAGKTAIALGHGASASAESAVAIGTGASATATAVALGHGSTATAANTVSVGNSSLKRRIVNVAAGTADNDAVIVSQLKDATTVGTASTSTAGYAADASVKNAVVAIDGALHVAEGNITTLQTNTTVVDGTYNYISAGSDVKGNLVALDSRAKTNADNIDTKYNYGAIVKATTGEGNPTASTAVYSKLATDEAISNSAATKANISLNNLDDAGNTYIDNRADARIVAATASAFTPATLPGTTADQKIAAWMGDPEDTSSNNYKFANVATTFGVLNYKLADVEHDLLYGTTTNEHSIAYSLAQEKIPGTQTDNPLRTQVVSMIKADAANGAYDATTNYAANTIGAAIKGKVDTTSVVDYVNTTAPVEGQIYNATSIHSSLQKADSAIQGVQVNGADLTADSNKKVNVTIATGATSGTLAVNGTDVAVKNVVTTDTPQIITGAKTFSNVGGVVLDNAGTGSALKSTTLSVTDEGVLNVSTGENINGKLTVVSGGADITGTTEVDTLKFAGNETATAIDNGTTARTGSSSNNSTTLATAATVLSSAAHGAYDAEGNYADNTIGKALQGKQGTLTPGNGIDITGNKISVDYGSGLTMVGDTEDSKKLALKVDNSTVEVDATNGLQIKALGVGTTHLVNSAVTTAKIADDAITTAKILDENVTKAKLASGVQDSLDLADSAVQSVKVNGTALTKDENNAVNVTIATGATSGTLAVNGTDVAVKNVVTTDTPQTITGAKTFGSVITANGGLTIKDGEKLTMNGAELTTVLKNDATLTDSDNAIATSKVIKNAIAESTGDMATKTWVKSDEGAQTANFKAVGDNNYLTDGTLQSALNSLGTKVGNATLTTTATTLTGAINELDSEKFDKTGGTISGNTVVDGTLTTTDKATLNTLQIGTQAGAPVIEGVDTVVDENSDDTTVATSKAVYEAISGFDEDVVHKSGTETITGLKTFTALLTATGGMSVSGEVDFFDDVVIGTEDANRNLTINGGLTTSDLATLAGLNVVNGASVGGNFDLAGLATFSTANGMRFGSGQVVTSIVNVIDPDAADEVLQTQLVTAKAVRQYVNDVDAATREELGGLIDAEEAARQQADAQLDRRITTEVQARQAADNQLSTDIAMERLARQAADVGIETEIVAEKNARQVADAQLREELMATDQALDNRISAETAARKNADNALAADIDAESVARKQADNALAADIASEAQTRAEADEALAESIASEAQTRAEADEELAGSIASEAQTRAEADEALAGSIASEAQARAEADEALAGSITSEAQARAEADEALAGNIASEAQTRAEADEALAGNIASEAQTRAEADEALAGNIASEAQTRAEADEALAGNIASEAQARAEADEALAGNIASEAQARAEADEALAGNIASEAQARAEADEALAGNIASEAQARAEADEALAGNIASEAQARAEADEALAGSIASEAQTRAEADEALAGSIASEAQTRAEADEALAANIASEAQTRAEADAALAGNIASEAQTRADADAALAGNIASEAQTRAEADEALAGNIASEAQTRADADAALAGSIASEAQTRADADAALAGNIASEAQTRAEADEALAGNIASEAQTRAEADEALAGSIASEAQARAEADEALAGNIASEAQTRAEADEALNARIDSVSGDIASEAQTRAEADEALAANIASEAQVRAEADEALAGNIASEAQTRADADAALAGSIASEAQTRADADAALAGNIASEAQTRAEADEALAGNIASEAQVRAEADAALAGNIASEAQTRADADAALAGSIASEAQTRADADAALAGSIASEAQTRAEADEALAGNIASEAQTRAEADEALAGNIASEAQTRAEADEALAGNIASEAQTRAEADEALAGSIASEAQTRAEADEALAGSIASEAQTRAEADEALAGNIASEAQTRAEADEALNARIDSVSGDIASEAQTRAEADEALAANIASEAQVRAEADEALAGNIASEAQVRAEADEALAGNIASEAQTRAEADAALAGNIASEAQTRAEADAALAGNIASEAQTRSEADAALAGNIASEAQTRAEADEALAGNIASEAQTRAEADEALAGSIASEAQTRAEADEALNARIDSVSGDIASEAQTRAEADEALAANIASEAQVRAEADAALAGNIASEAQTRAEADEALAGNIASEAQTRAEADAALAGNIASEAQTRAEADEALAGNIASEAQTRAEADEALAASIASEAEIRAEADEVLDKKIDDVNDKVYHTAEALGGKFDEQTGEWSADLEISKEKGAVNYGNFTVQKIEVALEQIMSNVGDSTDLGDEQNGVTITNTVNKNISFLNSTIGDLKNLNDSSNITNGRKTDPGYNVPKNIVDVLNNIDRTLGTVHGLADKLREAGKYNGNLADGTTVEQHLTALDASIGKRAEMNNTTFSGYGNIGGMNVAQAMTSVASSIGTAAELGDEFNGISANNTVNKNIAALNYAIGDLSTLKETVYASDASNVTDAIKALDSNMYRLDYQVNDLNYKYKKLRQDFRTGMASMAAMTALAPNARAAGNTQLSLGTGAYSGHSAVAVGAYHWINNNLMLNMGASWGNSSDAVYRMGITYAW